jgi:hypothetical protein
LPMIFFRIFLVYGCLLPGLVRAQVNKQVRLLHFRSSHTSFPDTGRQNGYLYDSVLYTAADHYSDNSVLLIVPAGLQVTDSADLVFWFHGWRNNIDTAAVFYALTDQFARSKRNAVLVLAETAKNSPDSYGGKLENPAEFKNLVRDVMEELKKNSIIPPQSAPGHIVLAGHSGAFRVIARILQNGHMAVQEVFLFDALYSEVDKFMAWLGEDNNHHFIHWFTNHGGGTDAMSDSMMLELKQKHIDFFLADETGLIPKQIKNNRIFFIHSLREHNVIINHPDDFQLLLENSFVLRPMVSPR